MHTIDSLENIFLEYTDTYTFEKISNYYVGDKYKYIYKTVLDDIKCCLSDIKSVLDTGEDDFSETRYTVYGFYNNYNYNRQWYITLKQFGSHSNDLLLSLNNQILRGALHDSLDYNRIVNVKKKRDAIRCKIHPEHEFRFKNTNFIKHRDNIYYIDIGKFTFKEYILLTEKTEYARDIIEYNKYDQFIYGICNYVNEMKITYGSRGVLPVYDHEGNFQYF